MRLMTPLVIAALACASPAVACRVGGSAILRPEPPSNGEAPPATTVVKVHVEGFAPGTDSKATDAEPGRGFYAGAATVIEVVTGRADGETLRIYVKETTNCSYFGRGPARRVSADGYLVGRQLQDERGRYFSVIEGFFGSPMPWTEPLY